MAGVIRFVFSGVEKGISQLDALQKKVRATASAGGAKAGGNLLAKVGAGAGVGALGQIGAGIGGALGPIAGAAAAAGLALRAFKGHTDAAIESIKADAATRTAAAATIRGAVGGANEQARSFMLSHRGKAGFTDPASVAWFREQDKIQKQTDAALKDRALSTGSVIARQELAAVRSPESAALLKMGQDSSEQLKEQQKISSELSGFQEFIRNMGNAFTGQSRYQAEIDAARKGMAQTETN
jgi:hypothetical protein